MHNDKPEVSPYDLKSSITRVKTSKKATLINNNAGFSQSTIRLNCLRCQTKKTSMVQPNRNKPQKLILLGYNFLISSIESLVILLSLSFTKCHDWLIKEHNPQISATTMQNHQKFKECWSAQSSNHGSRLQYPYYVLPPYLASLYDIILKSITTSLYSHPTVFYW